MLDRAASMRREPTEPERRVWMALRDRRFAGHKFRRQAVFGSRIVDFFCPAKALAIEIDGETHDAERDIRRDANLRSAFEIETIRFTNRDVMTNLDGVLASLQQRLEQLPDRWEGRPVTTPQPPPPKRRGSIALTGIAPSSSEEGIGGGGRVMDALREATQRLAAASDTARLDAELLMAHALGVTRSHLLLHRMGDPVPAAFAALVARRMGHEPVAYITGVQEFFGLTFAVSSAVLIPRGDSEVLVEAALAARPDARAVLDCGTGSGALLLAVLANLPKARGVGIDRSPAALGVATANAASLVGARALLLERDWHQPGWADDLGLFDLILANPPYVEDEAALAVSVRDHEPHGALFAGPEGLDHYRVLIPQLPALLAPGGVALVEIGASQAGAVSAMAHEAGFGAVLHEDLGGRPRALELKISLGNWSGTA